MKFLRSTFLIASAALLTFFVPFSIAQVFTASLSGLVSDPASAAVPGAIVKIRNNETNDIRQATTGTDGRYIFSQLKPGSYEVTVEGKGFKRFVQPSLTLVASQVGEFNVTLVIGDATQSVQVSAEAPVLDTQSADKSATLSERAVRELPTNMRNPLVLVWATAGVVAVRTGISQATQDQNHDRFALNGGRDESAAILIDGVPSQSGDWGGALATPSVDAVQEVQVTRTTFDAQYGQTDGGVVSVVTKGGSDKFHGAAFDFLRNSALDANTWDNDRAHVKKPIFQRHQFGGGVGGPILRKKHLYFFGHYEGLRLGTPSSTLVNLPTATERSGDFSQTFNPNGTLSTIYNPLTTRADPNGSGLIRDPFPGNLIPKNMFDSVGSKVVSMWPAANLPGNPLTHALNYSNGGKTIGVNDRIDARIDWAKSEHFSVFGRVTKAWEKDVAPVLFGNGFDNNFSDQNPRHQVVIGATFVPNPTWVTNILVGTGRWREDQDSPSKGMDGTAIGLPSSLVSQFAAQTIPQFVISNYPQISNNRFLNDPRNSHNLQVNNTKQHHNHSIKFGFSALVLQVNSTDVRSAEFDFTRGMTAGPNVTTDSTTAGNAVASLLLGTGSGGNAPNAARLALTQKSFAGYVQDSWRLGRRLTLDFGLRYEVQRPATERYDRLNNFDFNSVNPLSTATGLNLKGGLVFMGSSNRGLWNQDSKDFAPRLGIAYKITDRLVLRSGYGIYFPPAWAGALAADGYSTTTSWVSSVGGAGLQPLNPLSNPFPQGLVAPIGSSQGLATLVGQSINAFQRPRPSPYVQAYTVDFQYQISGTTMVEVGYTGTQGRKLFYGYSQNVNQLDPKYLTMGSALNQQVRNPFLGSIQNGPLSAATIPQYQLLLPYPEFQQVNLHTFTPGASSSFNALAVKVNRRFDNGLMALISYQFSKAIDNASETQAWEISDLPRNTYNLSGERSISAHDVPQSFTASMVYELPVGKGRAHLNDMNRVANAVVGGWQVSTIVRFGSGLPLQFTAPNSLSPYGYVVGRPNITNIPDLTSGTQSPDRWFNTAAVTGAPAFTIGSAPRWVSGLRHGKLESSDLALMKRFQPLEWLAIQFRAEAFNLPNTPQYGKANTTFGAPTFGVITGTTYTTPRNIQFSLRASF